ncbi:CocE/NonD family hydrolase [Leptolyngbya sp. CCY15150]|uniref:CocE/NonD family hydrolase n=1 Tax=Leptolyngbya sp. CCY15150 TaxID=2767772 RepID=UPI00194DFC85|nr:CocE/NonD family hydrolase [Leptolyngbya sp. CCY15150]
MWPVQPKQTLSMHTRDGVRLDADVYYPALEGDYPVLLMRQPYGRAIASTVVYAHPAWYAAHGYIVVIQDVRGRGSSEGEFRLFAQEIDDGFDTVAWAASLPGSTGQVGMYGFSYQGMTQLYAAMAQPPALVTLCPSMIGYDLYADWAYEGGAFCLQGNLGWAIQLAAETARRTGQAEAYRSLYQAGHALPLTDPVNGQSDLLRQWGPDSHYHDWLHHGTPDDYWRSLSPQGFPSVMDLPMLHIGGWHDSYLRGSLRFYHLMAAGSIHTQHLWVGPWGHLPWGQQVGSVNYGPEAASPIDRVQLRWFDQFLKGESTGLLDEPPVQWFEMGSNQWRSLSQVPSTAVPYTLVSHGLATIDPQDGQLVQGMVVQDAVGETATPDQLVHDPWRPVPTVGGHAAFPAGSGDRTAVDCRTDVATYTTAPLSHDLHLAGALRAVIYCTADAPSFDLCAVVSQVDAAGRVMSMSQGYQRTDDIPPGQRHAVEVTLQPTCICIPAGHALRLSLSAACFPAYAVNPGTGDRPHDAQLMQAQIITLAIHSAATHVSQLWLPVVASP